MNVFLVRHEEATKNVAGSFAATADGDELTANGRRSSLALAERLRELEPKLGLEFTRIISSRSPRSMATAETIAEHLRREWSVTDGLESIRSGVLAGQRESAAWSSHPDYMRALTLYRAGLFNSYAIPEFKDKEDKKAFERRVIGAFEGIVNSDERDVLIISQRSPITAILIDCARRSYGYPRDFFGHVKLDLGCISWVVANDGSRTIRAVNSAASALASDDFIAL